jgi:glyoxylase-like metal-dependent hydrolase (beta-lactamase superfamily II)
MIIKTIQVGELRKQHSSHRGGRAEKARKAVVIDPGDEAEKIIDLLDSEKLKPILIVNTHIHPDHVGGNRMLTEKYDIEAAAGKDGFDYVEGLKEYFEEFSGMSLEELGIKRLMKDGDVIKVGKLKLKVLETPGHSKGGICLYADGVLFSGDTLFAGTYGRTDLIGGSENEMQRSIARLMELPDDTVVYPGHGRATTISEERGLYA